MTIVKYSPLVRTASPVDRLASDIFGQSIGRLLGSDGFATAVPQVNITESASDFRIHLQVPGFDKKDLHLQLVDDTLTVRGEVTVEDNEQLQYTRREFEHAAFERSFVLPATADANAIAAEHVNGVLRITVPKREESKPKTREITIG